jgi:hypothetical protein
MILTGGTGMILTGGTGMILTGEQELIGAKLFVLARCPSKFFKYCPGIRAVLVH